MIKKNVEILSDQHIWHKHGQKMVKENSHLMCISMFVLYLDSIVELTCDYVV